MGGVGLVPAAVIAAPAIFAVFSFPPCALPLSGPVLVPAAGGLDDDGSSKTLPIMSNIDRDGCLDERKGAICDSK